MPQGQCFLWEPGLLWTHVIADLIITLAYYTIPFFLFCFLKKRTDLQFSWIFSLFGVFIVLCGTSHLLAILTIWYPAYWLAGFVKGLTALFSIITAYLLWVLLPKILALPSPSQLEVVNEELIDEINLHELAENELCKFSLAIEHSQNLVMITDNTGTIEYCNPALHKITGYTKEELLGRNPSILSSSFTPDYKYKELWKAITNGHSWQGELLDRKKNGDLFWCLHSIASIKNTLGQITHYVSVAHDISERKDAEETIKKLAYYDPLTNLPNRSLFKERIEQAALKSKRSHAIFALMYLDLDRFKSINDTLGHIIGDKLLIEVGKRIKSVLREQETVARLGGDEFAIILNNIEKPESAGIVADKVLKEFLKPIVIDKHELFISTSLGISIYPDDSEDIETLIKKADAALYHAKDLGRSQYAFFNPTLDKQNQRHVDIEMGLRKAISENEFTLLYQPKIDANTQSISGVEALIRWHSKKLGEVSPVEFIPVAENTGQIDKIGRWVLSNVCIEINRWKEQHQLTLPVSINLSAKQFKQETLLLSSIDKCIKEFAIEPELLEFEITESAIMDDPEKSQETMLCFKKRQLKLSIDDFGTGYSSLGYLKRFPVSTLKIDRSFVKDITRDKDDAVIVSAMITLAHNLGLNVIAEGVENSEQLEFLKKYHCDEVQGYYYNPPLTSQVIIEKYADMKNDKVEVQYA